MSGTGYLGTLVRFGCLAAALGLAMVLTYRLLKALGRREATAAGYAFILPWLVGLAVFSLFPMLYSLSLSFTRYGILSAPQWVGLAHYRRIFSPDPIFLDAAVNTVVFASFSVVLGILASLGAALLLSLDLRLMGFWRAVYYVPSVIPAVSTALLWRWIFVPEGGLVNGILASLRLPQPGWFSDPNWVIPAFVIMGLQGAAGNNMVILMGIIGGLLIFTQPMFIKTPGRSGLFYAVYVYRTGWGELRMGYACALSWVLFAGLIVLTLLVVRTSRRWVSYEQSDVLIRSGGRVLQPRGVKRRVWYGAVVAGACVMILPIFWMVSTSLKSPEDLFSIPPKLLSLPLRWRNYLDAWVALPFWRYLVNTLFVTALAMAGEVLTAGLVAYGFARFDFPGKKTLFGVLLSTLMIPGIVLMVPVFLIWRRFGLVGTFDPLVLGSVLGGGALFVFIYHQFFKTLPKELEEAARLDGASHGRVFFSIILPMAKPVFLVIALISFQGHWNDFLGPLLYLNDPRQYTMTMGLHFFQGAFMGEAPKWHWMMAITTLMAAPTVVIFLLTQRSFFRQGRPSLGAAGL